MNWRETLDPVPTEVLRRVLEERQAQAISRDPRCLEALMETADSEGVTAGQIMSKNRGTQQAALARREYCAKLKSFGYTAGEIGLHLGGRRPSSVFWMLARHRERMEATA